jgi:predicted site-specific integrase-resolvase
LIKLFYKSKFPKYSVITDIGSGINYKRKGFQTILDRLFSNNIKEVVIVYPYRFSRFSFELFQSIFTKFGATLRFFKSTISSPEDELLSDIMEVLTVFTARYYGKRKYNLQKIRFFPNTKQKILFNKCFQAHRFFYNKAINEINNRYNNNYKNLIIVHIVFFAMIIK